MPRRRSLSLGDESEGDDVVVAGLGKQGFLDDTLLDLGLPLANSTAVARTAAFAPPDKLNNLDYAHVVGMDGNTAVLFRYIIPFEYFRAVHNEKTVYIWSRKFFLGRDLISPMFSFGREQPLICATGVAAAYKVKPSQLFELLKLPDIGCITLKYLYDVFPEHGAHDNNKYAYIISKATDYLAENGKMVQRINGVSYFPSPLHQPNTIRQFESAKDPSTKPPVPVTRTKQTDSATPVVTSMGHFTGSKKSMKCPPVGE